MNLFAQIRFIAIELEHSTEFRRNLSVFFYQRVPLLFVDLSKRLGVLCLSDTPCAASKGGKYVA